VADTVVVGVPHERFGEAVAALVQTAPQAALTARAIIDHVRLRLADHKAPRHVLFVDSLRRGPNGKTDYMELRRYAAASLAQPGS